MRISCRSLGGLFRSPLAYVVLTFFLLCSGFFFYNITLERTLSFAAAASYGSAPAVVSREFWRISGWILLFVAPIISMSSIAGEKSRGTIELLLTSPLRIVDLILGKFLALVAFLLIMMLPTVFYFLLLQYFTDLAVAQVVSGYAGFFMLGLAVISIGIFISSLTTSQVVAAFGAFGTILIFWFIDAAGNNFPSYWRNFVRFFSLYVHYKDVAAGNFGLDDATYFFSVTFFFLFLAQQSIHMLWAKGKWS